MTKYSLFIYSLYYLIYLLGVYFSHETSTHASPTSSCAYNELYGLRKAFGDDFQHLLILNTKVRLIQIYVYVYVI